MTDTFRTQLTNKDAEGVIRTVLSAPQVLDEIDEKGTSGLLLIAYSGLEDSFRVAIQSKKSFTFHEAIVCGKTDQVRDALAVDKRLANRYSGDGFTPLSLAAFFDQTEIAKLLLAYGGDPNLAATNPSKVNALHSAVAKGNLELCKILIEHGVDVDAGQTQNVTALHSAAHKGNVELVKLLVSKGAKASLKMDNGNTAIDLAKKDGHSEIQIYLESISK